MMAPAQVDYAASGFALPPGATLPTNTPAVFPTPGGYAVQGGMPAGFGMNHPPIGSAQGVVQAGGYRPTALPMTAAVTGAPYTGSPYPGSAYVGGAVQHPSASYGQAAPYGVVPVGFQGGVLRGYMAQPCDAMGACECTTCDAACDTDGCEDDYSCGFEGILPTLAGLGGGNAAYRAGKATGSCLGQGGVLGSVGDPSTRSRINRNLAALFDCIRPYSEAGRCAQRWYDVSVGYMGLTQSIGGGLDNFVLTNFGNALNAGVADNPALTVGDAEVDDLESGVRLSLAVIFGVGGNLEMTYMGGFDWGGFASVQQNGTRLTSFASDFGDFPPNGFANTEDRQSIAADADFHSLELNYRRRTVGPNCRFQGSWLVGLRYLRYDNGFDYNTFETGSDIRTFNQNFAADNNLFGAQVGGDYWVNIIPGLHLGVEGKVAWLQNDFDSRTRFSNAAADIAFERGERDGTVMGELIASTLYRIDYAWTARASYNLIVIDDVVTTSYDRDTTFNFIQNNTTTAPGLVQDDVTLQGFEVGLEYLW